jgi:hypothetical protein
LNIINNEKFLLYPNYNRNLIHINEFKSAILAYLSEENKIINIANPKNINVGELIKIIENLTNKNGLYDIHLDKNIYNIELDDKFPYDLFNLNYYEENIKSFLTTLT